MSQSHARAVASLVPAAADKVSNLDPDGDIEDPIGGDVSLYKEVADRIGKLIEKRLAEGIVAVTRDNGETRMNIADRLRSSRL